MNLNDMEDSFDNEESPANSQSQYDDMSISPSSPKVSTSTKPKTWWS
jgi:hypothetical protein